MRNRGTILTVVAMTLALLSGTEAFAQGPNRLTLMSWNLHGANPNSEPRNNCDYHATDADVGRFAQVVRGYNATHARQIDVLTLQEVKRWQVIRLRDKLRDSQHPYVSYFVKTKTCKCDNANEDYGNAIISRLSLSAPREFRLSPPPPHQACHDNGFEETKLAGYSVKLTTGQQVRVYNAHQSGINVSDYLSSLQAFEALVGIFWGDAYAPGQPRVILAGDFNAYPSAGPCRVHVFGSDPYWIMTQWWPNPAGRLIDAWVERPDANNLCGYTAGRGNPRARYDYVFRSRGSGLRTDHIEVIKPGAVTGNAVPNTISDHFPLVADLSF